MLKKYNIPTSVILNFYLSFQLRESFAQYRTLFRNKIKVTFENLNPKIIRPFIFQLLYH